MLIAATLTTPSLWAQNRRVVQASRLAISEAHWMVHDPDGLSLMNPNKLVVTGDLVVLTDPAARAVHAYDLRTGRLRWTYAKAGRGPTELWGPVLPAWHPEGVVIADNATARLHILDRQGHHMTERAVPLGQFVTSMCARPNGDILINVASLGNRTAFTLSKIGGEARPFEVLFPLPSGSPTATAVDLTDVGGGSPSCIAARKTEGGLAVLGSDGVLRRGAFVESLRQRPAKRPSEIRDTADLPIPFSLRAGFDGTELYVWFGGKSCANRCIDLYDPVTLAYRRSLRVEGRTGISIRDLVLTQEALVVLGTYEDAPVIASFPRGDRSRR